jgi:hypothetical protein
MVMDQDLRWRTGPTLTGVTHRHRLLLDSVLNWATLLYGCFATLVEPVWRDDEVQIAIGGEVVVIALVGFLFAGSRVQLGWALITSGLCATAAVWTTAPLFYSNFSVSNVDVVLVGVSAVIGLPLVLLGVYTLRRRTETIEHGRPWWLVAVRWLVVVGMWVVVFAFRSGDWDRGITYVYAGGALALVGLLVALSHRMSVTVRGIGLFLLFLGGSALLVIGVGAAAVGSHMSGDEAVVGIAPAVVVAVLGGVLAMRRPAPKPTTQAGPTGADPDERIDDTAAQLLS